MKARFRRYSAGIEPLDECLTSHCVFLIWDTCNLFRCIDPKRLEAYQLAPCNSKGLLMKLLFALVSLAIGMVAVAKTDDLMDRATNVVVHATENPHG